MSASGTTFYTVEDRLVAVVKSPNGTSECVAFDPATGEMSPDSSYLPYLAPGSGKEVQALTETAFETRLAACRIDAGARAIGRLRTWAQELCSTTGGPAEVAAALGFRGTLRRDEIVADPVPLGYAKLLIAPVMTTGASITFKPAGRLLTREMFDRSLGAGRDVPAFSDGRLQQVAYHVTVPGAPASCTMFVRFERSEAPATEIMLRRDVDD